MTAGTTGVEGTGVEGAGAGVGGTHIGVGGIARSFSKRPRNLSWHSSEWGTPSATLSQPLQPGVLPYLITLKSHRYVSS